MKKPLLLIAGAIAFIATIFFSPLIFLWLTLLGLWLFYLMFRGAIYRLNHGKTELEALIEAQDQKYNTKFSTNKLGFGTFSTGYICFDAENKKILLIKSKDNIKIVDYQYMKSWQLHYTEVSKNGVLSHRDVHFQFSTTDINNPTVRIGVPSKRFGEDWNNRLDIIFG
ncbi:hypothetical protein PSEUDO8Z_10616 [Pseudomonas sp. 8Z]|uniref:hypothetical protein n=1 Tax=Pseudomonas sp. 8Z TaxID=2653166 RepID=UPI0012F34A7B|nr:hypothetical protein [Pseudomonas sp. 8Z]VXC27746.1 hypothetical protein PSEUDO8Z_10616 [Pseudomonas sp. 8Z]